jgi:hypothetical protein
MWLRFTPDAGCRPVASHGRRVGRNGSSGVQRDEDIKVLLADGRAVSAKLAGGIRMCPHLRLQWTDLLSVTFPRAAAGNPSVPIVGRSELAVAGGMRDWFRDSA